MDKLEGGRASPSGGDIKHDIDLDKKDSGTGPSGLCLPTSEFRLTTIALDTR